MKLTLTTDQGEVMDQVQFSWSDWRRMQTNHIAAQATLGGMHSWQPADEDPDKEYDD